MSESHDAIEVLDRRTCLELLGSVAIGRVAWTADDSRVVVLPVNFVLDDGDVVFRTAPGGKLAAADDGRPMSFQADDAEPALRAGWSVLVTGVAEIVASPEGTRYLAGLPLTPWADPAAPFYVRLLAHEVTGRRLRSDALHGRPAQGLSIGIRRTNGP